jgi:hypothetical protein
MRKIISRRKNLVKLNKDSAASIGLSLVLIALTLYPIFNPQKANAAVTESFVRFDRLGTGEAISGSACLNTSTSGTETGVTIVFPSDWTISGTASNWTVTTTNLPTGAGGGASSAWPGINTASSVNGLSVTFPSTDLSTATLYCFNFAGASSTVGPAGNNKTGQLKTTGGSPFVDTVDWATSVVSADADQITVTASVSASMTFTLSANSVSLGTINPNTTTAGSAITQTVSTNARNGWISWVKSNTDGGSNAGALASVTASSQIDSPGSFGGGTETLSTSGGYVLDVNSSTGAPAISTEYDGSTADEGGHISYDQFRQTATENDPADGDQVTLVVKARSSVTTPAAADYTDTLTVVAAGSF